MVFPIIDDFSQGFRFGKRGKLWKTCDVKNGRGLHTGVDMLAHLGVPVVAARPGTVRYVTFGSALGNHQIAVDVEDGTRDFYAHMRRRHVADGSTVTAGQKIGEVGAEGNTGNPPVPHLHFERHRDQHGWRCGVHVDPAASLDWQPAIAAMARMATHATPAPSEPSTPSEEDQLMAITVKNPATGEEWPIERALWSMWKYILDQRDDPDETARKTWEQVVFRDGRQISVKQELADDKTLAIANARAISELKAKVDTLTATVAQLATMVQGPNPNR